MRAIPNYKMQSRLLATVATCFMSETIEMIAKLAIVLLWVLHDQAKSEAVLADRNMKARIINGNPVEIERFPFSVQFFNDGSMCGASILTSWAVLTAGHCFDINKNTIDMNICVGEFCYVLLYASISSAISCRCSNISVS